MKVANKAMIVATVALVVSCGQTRSQSTVKENSTPSPVTAAAERCKAAVINDVQHRAEYGSVETASFNLLTSSENFGSGTVDAIFAEIDLVDSETSRWVASFNGNTCQVTWAEEFVFERWNTELTPTLRIATDKAIAACRDSLVGGLRTASGDEKAEASSLKMLAYSTEASRPGMLMVEVRSEESETSRWVASLDANSCKISWMHTFSYDR